jgi:tetraacyldisaccharide 4'-kinase
VILSVGPPPRHPSPAERWQRLVSGEASGLAAALGRAGLSAFAGAYWLGLEANLALYNWRLRERTQAPLPVLSVGNLTLGGTGKTTAVRFLAQRLGEMGIAVGVALRGHGRQGRGCFLVGDLPGQVVDPETAGDEATEYGRLLPALPVAVGKRREIALALLASRGVQVGLLDDGYQYFRMARDWEIALVSARTDPRLTRLFPRGVLREPWSHLRRATQVWITHADQASDTALDSLRGLVRREAPQAPVALARHAPQVLVDLATGIRHPLRLLTGQRAVALSGLGSPETFEQTVRHLGGEVVALRFPDHHRYRPEDWAAAAALAQSAQAPWIVTTEKDAVKLPGDSPWPTLVLRSELEIVAGDAYVGELLEAVKQRVGTHTQA